MFLFPSCFYAALHVYKKKQKPQKLYTLFKHLSSTGTIDLSSSFNSSFLITLEFSLVIACLLGFALLTSLTGGIKYQVLPFHCLITTQSIISVNVRSDEVVLKVICSIQFAPKPHETLLLVPKCFYRVRARKVPQTLTFDAWIAWEREAWMYAMTESHQVCNHSKIRDANATASITRWRGGLAEIWEASS